LLRPIPLLDAPNRIASAAQALGDIGRSFAFGTKQKNLRAARNPVFGLARAQVLLQNRDVLDL
jgi:hypothetical protein